MNRRNFLRKSSGKSSPQKVETPATTLSSTLAPYTGWGSNPKDAQHLLRRTLFGAPKAAVDYFKTMTLDQAVDQLLSFTADYPPTPPSDYYTEAFHDQLEADLANGIIPTWLQVTPAPPVNDYVSNHVNGTLTDDACPKGMPWVASSSQKVTDLKSDGTLNNWSNVACGWVRRASFIGWWSRLMVEQNSNIREKMTLFWQNFFAMRILNDGQHWKKRLQYRNNARLRYHALGNYKEMLKDIAKDPMMLEMLDLRINRVDNLNENFAREVQELFLYGLAPTLVDDGSSYTDDGDPTDDVHELARLLTGWSYRNNYCDTTSCNHLYYCETAYSDWGHDTGNKQFSSFYNNTVINGVAGATGGEDELDQFLDMAFNIHGLTIGKHLARRIYRFFIKPSFSYDPQSTGNTPTDTQIEQDIIVPLANLFVSSGFEIRPMMETLLKSEHFFDDCNRASMVKSPIDFIYGWVRETGYANHTLYDNNFVPINDINADRGFFEQIFTEAYALGQGFTNPVNVYGWDAYYNAPFDNNWVNGATYARRFSTLSRMMTSHPVNLRANHYIDYSVSPVAGWYKHHMPFMDFISTHVSNPYDDDELVDVMTDMFLAIEIHSTVKDALKNELVSNLPTGYTWAYAWSLWESDPTTNEGTITNALRNFFQQLFNLEEYHLM